MFAAILHRTWFYIALFHLVFGVSGCSLLKRSETDVQPDLAAITADPLPPEEAREFLKDSGENWLYGPGLGSTAIAAGTVVLFPPYALYLVGNAVLTLNGYEPVHVSSVLPEKEKEAWSEFYDSVSSGPGRFSAAVAGEEFRTPEAAQDRMKKYFERNSKNR